MPIEVLCIFWKVTAEFPGRRLRVVAAFSSDKDSTLCLEAVLRHAAPEKIHLAEVSFGEDEPSAANWMPPLWCAPVLRILTSILSGRLRL